jgi:uncharacterized protein (DUF2147 family)
MPMSLRILLLIGVLVIADAVHTFAQQAEADAVVGTWLTEPKNAKVRIFRRGAAYFGKIVWLKEPNNEKGEAKLDKENPEEKLRNRPIMGLEMLRDFVYDEDLVWEDGEIYDPKNGKTYSCKMTLSADRRTLDVRGYIGISLIGRTQVWTRTDD